MGLVLSVIQEEQEITKKIEMLHRSSVFKSKKNF
jgi:hypothetical protein